MSRRFFCVVLCSPFELPRKEMRGFNLWRLGQAIPPRSAFRRPCNRPQQMSRANTSLPRHYCTLSHPFGIKVGSVAARLLGLFRTEKLSSLAPMVLQSYVGE
jgi:hypothetical protein